MKSIDGIINEWDPIDLFPLAPLDEYIREIEMIEKTLSISSKITEEQLAVEVHSIFVKRFGNDVFIKDLRECKGIAVKILKLVQQPPL